MPQRAGGVQAVAGDPHVRYVEPDQVGGGLGALREDLRVGVGELLVQQHAHLHAAHPPRGQAIAQRRQGEAVVQDVVHQQHRAAGDVRRLQVDDDGPHAGAVHSHRGAVAAGLGQREVNVQRALLRQRAAQVGGEHERAGEHRRDHHLGFGRIVAGQQARHLAYPFLQRGRRDQHAPDDAVQRTGELDPVRCQRRAVGVDTGFGYHRRTIHAGATPRTSRCARGDRTPRARDT